MADGSGYPEQGLGTRQAIPHSEAAQKNKSSLPIYRKAAIAATAAVAGLFGSGLTSDITRQAITETGYQPNQPGEVQAAVEYHQNPWADQVRAELEGKTPLTGVHKIMNQNMQVITLGEPGTEKGIHLRDGYPSNLMKLDPLGPPQSVPFFIIKPGAIIQRSMQVQGVINGNEGIWYATKAKDIQGTIMDSEGINPINDLNPEQIFAISGTYVTPLNQQQP